MNNLPYQARPSIPENKHLSTPQYWIFRYNSRYQVQYQEAVSGLMSLMLCQPKVCGQSLNFDCQRSRNLDCRASRQGSHYVYRLRQTSKPCSHRQRLWLTAVVGTLNADDPENRDVRHPDKA